MLVIRGTTGGLDTLHCLEMEDEEREIGAIKTAFFSFCVESIKVMEEWSTIFSLCPNMIVQGTKLSMTGRVYKINSQIVLESETFVELIQMLSKYNVGYYIIDKLFNSEKISGFHNHPVKMYNVIMYKLEDFELHNYILPTLRAITITNILEDLC